MNKSTKISRGNMAIWAKCADLDAHNGYCEQLRSFYYWGKQSTMKDHKVFLILYLRKDLFLVY